MSTVSANLHVKDENGNLYDVNPTTTIANVTGLQTALNGKVNTVSGKGLSSNDYTTDEKNKLEGIEAQANKTIVDSALSSSSTNPVQNKVVNTALDGKVDKVSGKGLSTEDYTTAEKTKLDSVESNANNYIHPTTSGNKHIPSGGASGKILGWKADGDAQWVDAQDAQNVPSMSVSNSKTLTTSEGYCYLTDWTKNLLNVNLDLCKKMNPDRTWNGNSTTFRGVTYTVDDATHSIAFSGTSSSNSTSRIYLSPVLETIKYSDYWAVGVNSGYTGVGFGFTYCQNPDGSTWLKDEIDQGTGTKINTNYPYFRAMIKVEKGHTADNLTTTPMFMKGTTPHAYVPYDGYTVTSSNSDGTETDSITVGTETPSPVMLKTYEGSTLITSSGEIEVVIPNNTQANAIVNSDVTTHEDRNALIEVMNKGAKNLLKINKGGSVNAPCFTSDLMNTVTIDGTIGSGSAAYFFNLNYIDGNTNALPAGDYVISSPDDMTDLRFAFYETVGGTSTRYTSSLGDSSFEFTVSANATSNRVRIESNEGKVFDNRSVRIMICTKAEWRVSQEYEPNGLSNSELTAEMREGLMGADLLDKAESWLFAHHITDSATPQGFCVFNYNNVNYAACATNNNVEGIEGGITLYNLDTGVKIRKITNNLFSHLNDITYYNGHIFITNGDDGINDSILDLNLANDTVTQKSIAAHTDEKVHGITWNGAYFYILTHTGAVFHLHKYNEALTKIISTVELWRGSDFSATQGLFSYGNYVFFIRGQNDREKLKPYYNVMQVYSADTLQSVKTIYVPWGAELEGVGELNGEFYFYYNVISKSGVIMKGTILNGEKTMGIEADPLIGLGRFEKSVDIFIDETNTNFFLDLTSDNPFTLWAEANLVMVNENTPRYNINLLSDITQGIAIHPVVAANIYVLGTTVVNGNLQRVQRSVSGAFAARNNGLILCSYLRFAGTGTCEFSINDYLRFENCVIDREGVSIETCGRLVFYGTSINYTVGLATISSIAIAGTFEAIDEALNPNRLVGGLRIEAIPTNKSTGWKPISNSITGVVFASSLDICKKLLNPNLRSLDGKTLSNSDVIADLNLPGRYLVGNNTAIVDAPPTNERGFIELTKGYNDANKRFIYTCTGSAKQWIRTISGSYDSGWVELCNDTHPTISLFEKIGVIGDGFASGEHYTTGSKVDDYSISWLQILARQSGFTGTNYSDGGINSKTWMTNNHGLPLLQSSDPENLYLIAFGINDSRDLTLGTSADIGTQADTFYAYYSKIISEIQTKSSEARIICLSTARFGGNYDTFSEAIQEIAESMNVPFVDIRKHPYFKTAFYSDNQVSSHPTALNYSAMASAYKELIENCMKENQAYFNAYVPATV